MKLVVLDGHTLNPGDLDWGPLEALAPCRIYDRTPGPQIIERADGAELLLTNKTPLTGETIRALAALKYIGVLATGYNVVDLEAASARPIIVTNVPGYGTASVAQHVFALLLELVAHTGHHAQTVAAGRWSAQPDFCYWDRSLVELAGKTLGVVGWGAIGQRVGGIAAAFGMTVVAAAREESARDQTDAVPRVPLDVLFSTADVVTLHCPLTAQTKGLVNADCLSQMKPSSYLINTARGPLIVEQALADALNAGRIAGAGLDVLSVEPPPPDNPLLSARNCLITPHIAWASRAARSRLLDEVVANVKAFLAGRPRNVVNA